MRTPLTGLSISYSLSLASIDHVLVGRRPDTSPRLGESLNLQGTLLLWEMFPQLSRFFFPKREVLGYLGDYEVQCDFAVSQRAVSRAIFRTLGYAPAEEFLQVDRIGFDAALWDLTVASEHCTVIDGPVAALEFDVGTDRFASVCLADGEVLRTSSPTWTAGDFRGSTCGPTGFATSARASVSRRRVWCSMSSW